MVWSGPACAAAIIAFTASSSLADLGAGGLACAIRLEAPAARDRMPARIIRFMRRAPSIFRYFFALTFSHSAERLVVPAQAPFWTRHPPSRRPQNILAPAPALPPLARVSPGTPAPRLSPAAQAPTPASFETFAPPTPDPFAARRSGPRS